MVRRNRQTTRPPLIIRTKLIAPKLGKSILRRERLLKLLNENADKRCILVCAGPGYGKTTLLTQWVNELPHPFVWYDLDDRDRDIAVFLSYLIEGLRLPYPDFGKLTESALLHTRNLSRNLETVAGALINEIVDLIHEDTFLILDGYHDLEGCKPVDAVLDYLLSRLPENFHLVLSSREEPTLSLGKLRAEGQMLEITREELAFSHREVVLLFRTVYKQKVSDETLAQITEGMRGWATGLQLYSQTKRLPASYEPQKRLFDYFAQEILERQPAEIREFLLKTSILSRMSADICNQLLGLRKSREILEEVERRNLFVRRIEEESSFYRYHPVFQNFLRNSFRATRSGAPKELHLKAASYFKRVGDLPEAINHYLQAGRYGLAARAIEKSFGEMMAAARYDTLHRWLEAFPKEIVARDAHLNLWMGEVLFQWGDWNQALIHYRKAKWRLERAQKKKGLGKANLGLARILTQRGEFKKALRLGKRALSSVAREDHLTKIKALQSIGGTYFSSSNFPQAEASWAEALALSRAIGDRRSEALLIHNLGLVASIRGDFQRAGELYGTLTELRGYGTLPQMALAYCNSASISAAKGDYENARKALDTALEISNLFSDRRAKTFVLTNLGELALDRREYAEAEESLKKALKLNQQLAMPQVNIAVYGNLSRLYLSRGEYSQARDHIHLALQDAERLRSSLDQQLLNLIRGEIELETENLDTAERIFDDAASFFRKMGTRFHETRAHFYLAKTHFRSGQYEKSLRDLRRSIELCERYGYGHFLTQEMTKEPPLLGFSLKGGILPGYLERLRLPQVLAKESAPSLGEPDLRVSLLGPLRVLSREGALLVERWRTQKVKSVFAYLFAHPERSHPTERLTDIFYPDRDVGKAKKDLYSVIFFIREILEPDREKGERPQLLLQGSQGYYLSPNKRIWVDVQQFRRLVKEGDGLISNGEETIGIDKYRQASALYKGDFAEELYDSWAEDIRTDLRNVYLKCLKRLGDHHFQAGDHATSLEYLRLIIEREPYQEDVYCRAMECLGRLKDRAGIIRLYERLQRLLKEDLGLEPLPVTKEVYQSLIG